MSDTPAPAPVPTPATPASKLVSALDGDLANILGKYGVALVMVWQFVAGGIETSIRKVVREELAGLQKTISTLELRVAVLESKPKP